MVPFPDKESKIKELAQRFGAAAKSVDYLDGMTVEFGDWWFNVRPSNTEPYLRLNLEARTRAFMQQKRNEV